MKEELWAEPTASDPLRLVKYRDQHRIHKSGLPGALPRQRAELQAMYALRTPQESKMLRAVRARRAIDAIDVFHAVLQTQWDDLPARDRILMHRASTLATRLQNKLRGLANPHP